MSAPATPELAGVLAELMAREPIFHRPELGTTRAHFDGMIADDFWEVGASGKVYERAFVLDLLEERHRTPQEENLQPTGFRIRQVGIDTYLLHYDLLQGDLLQGDRHTRRTTVWQRSDGGWKIVFHQGTIVA